MWAGDVRLDEDRAGMRIEPRSEQQTRDLPSPVPDQARVVLSRKRVEVDDTEQ